MTLKKSSPIILFCWQYTWHLNPTYKTRVRIVRMHGTVCVINKPRKHAKQRKLSMIKRSLVIFYHKSDWVELRLLQMRRNISRPRTLAYMHLERSHTFLSIVIRPYTYLIGFVFPAKCSCNHANTLRLSRQVDSRSLGQTVGLPSRGERRRRVQS